MTSKQITALALIAAAIGMLSFCTLTKRWFHVEYRATTFNIGLLEIERCGGGECQSESLGDAEVLENYKELSLYVSASRVTFGLGLASAALLLVLMPFGIKPNGKVGPLGKLTLGVLILTVFAAMVVMLKKPPLANAGLGVFLFMIGGMAGVIGAHMLSSPSTYEEIVRDPSVPRL
jgi:hypothetical protein